MELTDPAYEFAMLCKAIPGNNDVRGLELMASTFGVAPNSFEFYQIIFTIIERGEYLIALTSEIAGAEHVADHMRAKVQKIMRAFQPDGLLSQWKSHGSQYLAAENVDAILMMSPLIRQHVSYPALSDEDRASLISEVDELLAWLTEHQLAEQDFIRQALIDGLRQLRFRVERLSWLGWGYTIASLKDVLAAYMALERGYVDDGSQPMTGATIKKTLEKLKKIYAGLGVAKEAVDRGDFILRAYGAATLIAHAKTGVVAGLLTYGG